MTYTVIMVKIIIYNNNKKECPPPVLYFSGLNFGVLKKSTLIRFMAVKEKLSQAQQYHKELSFFLLNPYSSLSLSLSISLVMLSFIFKVGQRQVKAGVLDLLVWPVACFPAVIFSAWESSFSTLTPINQDSH